MERLLVLVRHGQSDWNLKNLFTGWKDPDLTEKGVAEAKSAGQRLKALDLHFDLGVAVSDIRHNAVSVFQFFSFNTDIIAILQMASTTFFRVVDNMVISHQIHGLPRFPRTPP